MGTCSECGIIALCEPSAMLCSMTATLGSGHEITFGSATLILSALPLVHPITAFSCCARSSQIRVSVSGEQPAVVQPVSKHDAGTQAHRLPSALKFTVQQCCFASGAAVLGSNWHGTASENALSRAHRLQTQSCCFEDSYLHRRASDHTQQPTFSCIQDLDAYPRHGNRTHGQPCKACLIRLRRDLSQTGTESLTSVLEATAFCHSFFREPSRSFNTSNNLASCR